MRFKGPSVAMLGLCFAVPLSAEEPPARPEYSVLTPAVESEISVVAGFSGADLVPYFGSTFKSLATSENSLRLRRLAAQERFDPARRLADQLVEALAEAGHAAVHEPIPRKPPGAIQSLARSDLPEKPKGELILDVTIRWICLCRGDKYYDYSPSLSLGWRVLDPRGGIVEPTRVLNYVHDDGPTPASKASKVSSKRKPPPESSYPPATVSANCNFGDPDDGLDNPTVLWGCFGEAMAVATRRLVLDLEKARAGHGPVTASGDNRS